MRRLTKEEKGWKNDFERTWERGEADRPEFKRDIMNKGVRYGTDFEEPIVMSNVDQTNRSHCVDHYVRKLLTPGGVGRNESTYSPADYYALPEQWFTHKWTDRVNKLVDRQRGKEDVEDSEIPGIVKKRGLWEVNRFFEGKSLMLGRFLDLDDAKICLKDHNKKITKCGYGVDYE